MTKIEDITKAEVRDLQNGHSLLDCALELHIMVTGAKEYNVEEAKKLLFILKAALVTWEDSHSNYADFDEAVRFLIKETILEHEILYTKVEG